MVQVNPFEDKEELCGFDKDVPTIALPGNPEGPSLKAFGDQDVPVPVPIEHSNPVCAGREEDEDRAGEGVFAEVGANKGR